jgi:hypothetical protein
MNERKFWPFDFDPEGEIYEALSWDLPGYRPRRKVQQEPRRANAGRRES